MEKTTEPIVENTEDSPEDIELVIEDKPKTTEKKGNNKKETVKKEKKLLTIHKNWLIDIRRHHLSLGIYEGQPIITGVITEEMQDTDGNTHEVQVLKVIPVQDWMVQEEETNEEDEEE